jgi:protein SCO1/2
LLVCWLAVPVWAQELSAGNQPAVLREIGIDQRLDRQVPLDLVFRDETGKSVHLGDYFGEKPVLLSLVYYECPMLCTLVLNGLLRSLRALAFDVGKQFNVVTVSVDPGETPSLAAAKKAEYIQKYSREGAEKGWHFLTGEEDSIQALADAVGFRYVYQPDRDEYAHASGIMILTPQGKLARYFYGIEYSTRDVRLALVEASANKIGSPVDQLLLYCYHYDPVTGKYGLLIMNTIRLAGLATVLALGVFMFVMFRRDRLQKSTIDRSQPLG